MHVIYDVSHNIAKVEEHIVNGRPKTLLVHRKGRYLFTYLFVVIISAVCLYMINFSRINQSLSSTSSFDTSGLSVNWSTSLNWWNYGKLQLCFEWYWPRNGTDIWVWFWHIIDNCEITHSSKFIPKCLPIPARLWIARFIQCNYFW